MDGTFGTGTPQYLKYAKEQGVRIVCVDPRRHRTSKALAEDHVYIRPSTDAAALIAMAYVILTENLHDQSFLDRYVQGFDEHTLPDGAPRGSSYRAYVGRGSSIAKTPEWAAEICGIPAETLDALQSSSAHKPAAIHTGYGRRPHAARRTVHRAAYALAAITSYRYRRWKFRVSNGAAARCEVIAGRRNPIN